MTLRDTFSKLKTTIVGTKTSGIDSKLDSAVRDIIAYKSNSGRNGYIDLIKSLISKGGSLDIGQNVMQQGTTPATFGQGGRLQRYVAYSAIVSHINYCQRALDVLVDNILAPDDITKTSLEVNAKSQNESNENAESNVKDVEEIIKKLKLEERLDMIVKNTLEYGDFFCEIADSKTALTSKSSFLSESIINIIEYEKTRTKEVITEKLEGKDIKIIMDFSALDDIINNDSSNKKVVSDLDDKQKRKKLKPEDLHLLFYEPRRVVKLQSDIFPICFGYLIFPASLLSPALMVQNQTVNAICQSILKSVERKIPGLSDQNVNTRDLEDIVRSMIKETDFTKAMNIRYVPPDRMQHFQRPSTKYYPYGESIFDSVQFNAKVLIAMETALAILRLNRSIEKRKIAVEVGLPRDAEKAIEKLKEEFKRRKVSLDSFGSVDTIACLSLETEIRLTNGKKITLSELIKLFNEGHQFEIYAYDHNTGKIAPDKVVSAKVTGKNVKVMKITLDNNESVICTDEHYWMLRDGTYLMAKNLKVNDSLMPLNRKSTKNTTNEGYTYEMIYQPGIGKYELTHQVFANYLNLYEDGQKEVIHHIDKNPRNNDTKNLVGLTRKDHSYIHSNEDANGGNIGKTQIIIKRKCIICGKEFDVEYFSGTSCCSEECFRSYKKEYSKKSWQARIGKNEYEILNMKCFFCGKEITIFKSKFNKMKEIYKNIKLVSCDDPECKKQLDYAKRIKNTNLTPIEYVNCIICGKLFIKKKNNEKINFNICSKTCEGKIGNEVRWGRLKIEKIKTKCIHCGKEIEIRKSLYDSRIFQSCNNMDCARKNAALHILYKKNNNKLYSDIETGNCIICGKPTIFNEKKSGFSYHTCGSKSCSSTVMHRSFGNKIVQVPSNTVNMVMNHKIKSIEYLEEKMDVGDIQTEKFHNFGLQVGVFVHNSQITSFEDIFIPQKDGKAYVDISSMTEGMADTRSKTDELKFIRDSIVAGLGVPPAFIGLEDNMTAKNNLSEENVMFARTIVNHQKYLTHQNQELIVKIYNIIDVEKSLTILDDVEIAYPAPKSLQFERQASYLSNLANLVETLERIGVPKEWSKKKYLTSIDWTEVEKYEVEDKIDKELKINPETGEDMSGMGGGLMGGGMGMGGTPAF